MVIFPAIDLSPATLSITAAMPSITIALLGENLLNWNQKPDKKLRLGKRKFSVEKP